MTIEELRVLITAKTDGLTEGVNKVKNKINELRGTTDNLTSSNQRKVDKMKTQYDQLLKKLDNVNARAEIQSRKLSGLQEKYSRMSAMGTDSPKMERLREQILNAENRMQSLINTSDNTNAKLTDLDDKMASLGINTEKSSNKFAKLQSKIEQIKDRFKRTGNEVQRSTGKVAGFANMLDRSLRRVLRRVLIYNVIYRMLRGMISYLNGALQTNNRFVSSLNAIRTNLRVAFQPIYDFILPAINALMRGLATLTSYIANFTSALFGKTYKQSYDAAKGIETAKKAMDDFGGSAKKAKGQLASFDEINVLQTKEDGSGAGGGFEMEMPEIPEFELGWVGRLKEKLEPTIEAIQRLVRGLEPLKEFAAKGVIDFYEKFLVPVGNWGFGEGLPRFIDAITNGLSKIEWDRINSALNKLWEALTPFSINVGEGLLWLWENVLIPLGTWTMNEVVPRFFELIANALKILNVTIEALKPLGMWLWEEFLLPLAQWTGENILQALDWLNEKLAGISKWIKENTKFVETLAIILGSLATAIGMVTIATVAWETISWLATYGTTALGVAFLSINWPLTLIVGAIAAVIAVGVLLYKNWDEIAPWIKETWEGIKAKATEIWGAIKTFLVDNVWNPIRTSAYTIWEGIRKYVVDPIVSAWNSLVQIWNNIKSYILTKWTEIGQGINGMASSLIEAIKSPFVTAKEWIDDLIKDAFNWGKNLIGNIIDGIKSMASKVKSTVTSVASSISNKLAFHSPAKEGPGADADKWMPNLMDMLAQGIRENVYKIDASVNMAANSLSGIDKTDNTNAIASAVGSAVMAAMGNSNKDSGDIVLQIEGTTFARIIGPYVNKEKGRIGVSLVEGAI